jgi:hypothetical protein
MSFLDSATVQRTCALWVGIAWLEERTILPRSQKKK